MNLIVASAQVDRALLLSYVEKADRIIAVDGGLNHLNKVDIEADIVLGDFDSYIGDLPKGAVVFPREKDFSDIEAALDLYRGEETVILGATGGRLDHFLSVLSLMRGREELLLVDEQNELFYRRDEFILEKRNGYFSLFPDEDTRITIGGARYELDNHLVEKKSSLLLSNSWVDRVRVRVESGWVLVVLSKDK